MKKKHTLILLGIVTIELATVLFLNRIIIKKRIISQLFDSRVKIVPMSKDDFNTPSTSELKYYYESKPDPQRIDHPDWLDKDIFYTINKDSFNDTKDYSIEKPENTFRIMTLGDSYTFGHYVDTQDNWTEKLEGMLNNDQHCSKIKSFEIINIAEPGFDVEYISHKFITRGKKYNPDLIIWYESSADFYRVNELLWPLVHKYQKIITEDQLEKSRASGRYFPEYDAAYTELYQTYSPEILLSKIGRKWLRFFELRGQTQVVIALPMYIVSSENRDWLRNLVKNISNVRIFDEVSNIESINGLYPDAHPNPIGHAQIATDLYTYLTNNKIIQCN